VLGAKGAAPPASARLRCEAATCPNTRPPVGDAGAVAGTVRWLRIGEDDGFQARAVSNASARLLSDRPAEARASSSRNRARYGDPRQTARHRYRPVRVAAETGQAECRTPGARKQRWNSRVSALVRPFAARVARSEVGVVAASAVRKAARLDPRRRNNINRSRGAARRPHAAAPHGTRSAINASDAGPARTVSVVERGTPWPVPSLSRAYALAYRATMTRATAA